MLGRAKSLKKKKNALESLVEGCHLCSRFLSWKPRLWFLHWTFSFGLSFWKAHRRAGKMLSDVLTTWRLLWFRAESKLHARQQDGRLHRGERLRGRWGLQQRSGGAARLQHDGLPTRHAGQQTLLLLRLHRCVAASKVKKNISVLAVCRWPASVSCSRVWRI